MKSVFNKTIKSSLLCGLIAATGVLATGCSYMPMSKAEMPAQSVSLLEPSNGQIVTSPFKVRFGVQGMKVEPAGDIVANSGHHHLLINLDALPAGEAVPFTEKHMHFGKGQTEAEVKLAPGVYKLTAQFANGEHASYGKAMSQTITVTVK